MRLGKFTKVPADNKRYTIDYNEWLDTGETLSTVTFGVTPVTASPLTAGNLSLIDANKGAQFYVAAGLDGENYTVTVTITTSVSQTKQDTILFVVRAP
jgi:hypothetical protein